jgi:hypothetical protein
VPRNSCELAVEATEMAVLSIGTAACALVMGLVAAWYWYRSTQVVPAIGSSPESTPVSAEVLRAMREMARLNKLAAIWAAGAVVLDGLSSVVAVLARST